MKKFLLFALLSASSLICAQQVQLNGGYPFKHNGNTCYFIPVNGLPAKIAEVKKPNGIALCLEAFPATVSRVWKLKNAATDDSFTVKFATPNGKAEARYKVELSS